MIWRPLAALAIVAWAGFAVAAPLSVNVINESRPTACAEEDNLYLTLTGNEIDAFRIEATLPDYLASVDADSTAPDFSGCDMSGDPVYRFTPQSLTLFDDGETKLVGHTFATNWRPNIVPVFVGGEKVDGLHLLQLFNKHQGRWIELLVLYPADGYWRVKPLPPDHMPVTAYGSSFLIGPIEAAGRPVVDLATIDIEPTAGRFRLAFARGGTGSVQVEDAEPGRTALRVHLDPPVTGSRPFAALRSMFVSPEMADASEVMWRASPEGPWQTQPIMTFGQATVESVRFGRSVVSRHNTSAPDLTFETFSGQ
jgi:hypothetical protein